MFRIDDNIVIDATMAGGPARYINHSCAPNCVAEVVPFEKDGKIIIIARRRLARGEEVREMAFMQRPVHSSYGRVKQNVDGCLFAWTCKQFFLNSYASRSPERRTAQSALHVMLLSYYIGMCVFHERQRDLCHRRAYSQGFAKAVHMSNDRHHFYPL